MSTFVDNRTQPLQSTLVDISIERVNSCLLSIINILEDAGHVIFLTRRLGVSDKTSSVKMHFILFNCHDKLT